MKLRKLISALIATTIVCSMFATLASAAVEFDWDSKNGVYWISNVADVASRTPYIEASVKILTGDEVVAVKNLQTGLSGLKMKKTSGNYGDTDTWTVYEVTCTVKGVGQLGAGYGYDEQSASVKLRAIDASLDISPIQALGTKNTHYATGIGNATETNTGVAWQEVKDGTKGGAILQLTTEFPAEDETAEGNLRNAEYQYKLYYVLPKGTSVTLNYTSSASVQYMVVNTNEGYVSDLILNKVGTRSAAITLAEPAEPSTYTVTFKNWNNSDYAVQTDVEDGATIAAPAQSPTREGYTFQGWSATQGGAVLNDGLGTVSGADKTFYAIFADTATYAQEGTDKDDVVGVETLTGGTVTTVDGHEVALDGTYKAAKFTDLDLDTAHKKYRVVLFDGEEKAIMPWINIGSDIEVYTSRIVVVVKELGTHTVTSIKIEEADID